MKCDACSAALSPKDIDEARALARCSFCGTLMDVSGRTGTAGGGRVERPEVPLPPKFRVERLPSGTRISWRWFTPAALFLAFFCVFWDGFLVVWYGMALAGGAPVAMILFPLIHVAVGVGLTYLTLGMFLNSTTVSVEKGAVVIRHAPLPWPGNRTLGRADVGQLFCAEKVTRGKNGVTVTYEVNVVLKTGKRLAILKGLEQDQALYVEQALERQLGIEDRPVAGELPR